MDGTFTFDIDCDGEEFDAENVQITTVDGVGSYSVEGIPTGTECTVTEDDNPLFTQTLVVPAGGTVTIGADGGTVEFTNDRNRGDLVVTKASDVDGTFTFDIDCTVDAFDAEDVEITTANGEGSFTVEGIPTGTECTVTEDDNPFFTQTLVVPGNGTVTIEVGDNTVDVTNARNETGLTTTPFVGADEVESLVDDIARVDEDDVISDRAELTGLWPPVGGEVNFFLYGPFDVTQDGVLTEQVTCLVDGEGANLVFTSVDTSIEAAGDRYEAFSGERAVGGEDPLAAGLYQWVADYSGDIDLQGFGRNLSATGDCPDATEQVIVREGDEPGVDKAADPADGSTVQPGSTITYTVVASNTGDVAIPADEAIVTDVLPEYLTFAGMTPAEGQPVPVVLENEDGTTSLMWSVGELAPGASVTLTYTATVSGSVPQGQVLENDARFLTEFDSTEHVAPTGDLSISKVVVPSSGTNVTPGDELEYTLTITSTGDLNQRDVVVTDYVPGDDPDRTESLDTTYVPGSADCSGEVVLPCDVTVDSETGLITWELGDMEAGSTRQVTFTVTVDSVEVDFDENDPNPVLVGLVLNAGSVDSRDSEEKESNQVENPVLVAPGLAGDLGLTKAVTPPGPAEAGDELTYTLTAAATGNIVQTGVTVTDYVPGSDPDVEESLETTLVDGSAQCVGDPCTVTIGDDGLITWALGDIAGGDSRQVTFKVTVDSVAVSADPGDVVNVGYVRSGETPKKPSNEVVTPVLVGSLTVSKAVSNSTGAVAGDRLTYTLNVSTGGNLTQTGVVVSDFVPGSDPARTSSLGTTYVAGSGACSGAGTCDVSFDPATDLVTWGLGDMAGGTTRTVTFVVTVDTVEGGRAGDILNAGSVTSTQTPPMPSNEVRTPVAAVLGTKVAAAPLPRTGAELGAVLWFAGGILVFGCSLVLVSRRREV